MIPHRSGSLSQPVAQPPAPAAGPPRRGSDRTRRLATRLLGWLGWRITGEFPTAPKAVLILAPHTSNLDFFICMPAMFAAGLRITWIAKHSLFFFPAAPILRWLGGEPINRRLRADTVQHAIARFAERDQYYLGLTPEGTRGLVHQWKTGFWHIARGARVPIIPIALDWGKRELHLMPARPPGDDELAEVAAIRAQFDRRMARHPGQFASAHDTPT